MQILPAQSSILITLHRRIKFTIFAIWQSFIFLQGKSPADLSVRVRKSRAYVFGELCQSRFGVFYASLTPKPSPFYARKCQNPRFAVIFRLGRADIAALRFSALISRREI